MSDNHGTAVVRGDTGAVIGTLGAGYVVGENPPPPKATDTREGGNAAEPEILDVRWGIQIRHDHGWSDYSQGTWPEDEKHLAGLFAANLYGGSVQTRLFKIVKTVDPDWRDDG